MTRAKRKAARLREAMRILRDRFRPGDGASSAVRLWDEFDALVPRGLAHASHGASGREPWLTWIGGDGRTYGLMRLTRTGREMLKGERRG